MGQPHIYDNGPYCTLCDAPHPDWQKAKVGFYWSNGDWNVCTQRMADGSKTGYGLTHAKRGIVGEFLTWTEVQQLVEGRM
jgi:hypothetical protein